MVEKVKPDPWNLSVNTGVGKQIHFLLYVKGAFLLEGIFFIFTTKGQVDKYPCYIKEV